MDIQNSESESSSEAVDVRIAGELIAQARRQGVSLVGPDGLLAQVTKSVLQTALEAEMTEHLGFDKGDRAAAAAMGVKNHRNGSSSKTVATEVGPVTVTVDVPRDRVGSFEPQIVAKHARRVDGFDEAIVSLYAKGLTTGEIRAHLEEIYGVEVSRDLISRVTDRVSGELTEWQNRPLDKTYAVILIDCIYVKIRDGAVANKPVYVAVGINLAGRRDVLGMWVGDGGEGARHWMSVLAELKNRGVDDVMIVCCDGLKGLPESINEIWPRATVQLCVVHLVRASLRWVPRQHWQPVATQLRAIYTAATETAAAQRFAEFKDKWGDKYPVMIDLWQRNWTEFVPFLAFPPEIRRVVYTTNMIESLNARFRQATHRRGHFPNDDAALKVLYLVIRDKKPNRPHVTGATAAWKKALQSFALYYGERITENTEH